MSKIKQYLEDPGCHPPLEIERYLNGKCEMFAIALSRMTGWDIVAIIEPRQIVKHPSAKVVPWTGGNPPKNTDEVFIADCLVHACCIHDSRPNEIFDAKGWRTANDLNKEYPLHPGCVVKFFNEKQLLDLVYPGEELDIIELRKALRFIRNYYLPMLGIDESKVINKCKLSEVA